ADEQQLQVVDDLLLADAELLGGAGQLDPLAVEQPGHHRQQARQPVGGGLEGLAHGRPSGCARSTPSRCSRQAVTRRSGSIGRALGPSPATSSTRVHGLEVVTVSTSQPSSPSSTCSARRRSACPVPDRTATRAVTRSAAWLLAVIMVRGSWSAGTS